MLEEKSVYIGAALITRFLDDPSDNSKSGDGCHDSFDGKEPSDFLWGDVMERQAYHPVYEITYHESSSDIG